MKTTTIIVCIIVLAIAKLTAEGIPDSYKIGPHRNYATVSQEVTYWAEGDYGTFNEETFTYEEWTGLVHSMWHANGSRRDDDVACTMMVRAGWNWVSGEGISFPEDNYDQDQFTGQ